MMRWGGADLHTREALRVRFCHNWEKLATPRLSLTSTGRIMGHKRCFVYNKGQRFKQQELRITRLGETNAFDVV